MTSALTEALQRREQLVNDLVALDADLDQLRALLSVPAASTKALPASILSLLEQRGPITLGDLGRATGRSAYLLHGAIRDLGDRVMVTGSTGHRIVRLTTDPREDPARPSKPESPRVLAKRTAALTCEHCQASFTPSGGGTSGRFCSVACWRATQRETTPPAAEAERAVEEAEPEDGPPPAPTPLPAPKFPERRCGRCCAKFTPTAEREYVCSGCRDKAPVKRVAETKPDLETVWSPGRDAAPLTGAAAGMGQSLSGDFKVSGLRKS